jgi:hypothetical protein
LPKPDPAGLEAEARQPEFFKKAGSGDGQDTTTTCPDDLTPKKKGASALPTETLEAAREELPAVTEKVAQQVMAKAQAEGSSPAEVEKAGERVRDAVKDPMTPGQDNLQKQVVMKAAIASQVQKAKVQLNVPHGKPGDEKCVSAKLATVVEAAAKDAGATPEEAKELSEMEQAALTDSCAREKAKDELSHCKEGEARGKEELKKAQKEAEKKAAAATADGIKVQLAVVKQAAANVALKKSKARVDLEQAKIAEQAVQNSKAPKQRKKEEDLLLAKPEPEEGEPMGEACKINKAEVAEDQKAAGALAAREAAAARRVGKAAMDKALSEGQCEEKAKALGRQARESFQQEADIKAKKLHQKQKEERMERSPNKFCTGWTPSMGKSKGKGGSCQAWGLSKRWCWVTADYEGPGREFLRTSEQYRGKLFAPCAAQGKFLSKYAATWAATGCPHMPADATWAKYAQEKDAFVWEDMFRSCSEASVHPETCCGPSVKHEDCKPVCKKAYYWTGVDGEPEGSNGTEIAADTPAAIAPPAQVPGKASSNATAAPPPSGASSAASAPPLPSSP